MTFFGIFVTCAGFMVESGARSPALRRCGVAAAAAGVALALISSVYLGMTKGGV